VSLAFLHTAPANVETFRRLVAQLDPAVPVAHLVLEQVLAGAVGTGAVTASMRLDTEAAIRRLAADGATVVVCTCSTIGGVAEATEIPGVRVMRIDRRMAELAVASRKRIVVAATLPSTLGPTRALIRDVAAAADGTVQVEELVCREAWPHFERGDLGAYAEAIADAVAAAAGAEDLVVLAQASMAPAAERLNARGIATLASPELGVRAALDVFYRHGNR
jgi:hypothetical protein